MNFLSKMERRFGKYAIPHLTMYIILTYAAGYVLYMMSAASNYSFFSYLTLDPAYIVRGQIWRLVSWWLIPPSSLSIFTLIMLFLYYQLGTLLERTWGDFLYNVYIFFGLIMTVIGAFILYAIYGDSVHMFAAQFSTYYISLSIFLGFAMTFPNEQLLFMFIIPIKIKYLAIVEVLYLAYEVWQYWQLGLGVPRLIMVVCSLASTLLFFILTRNHVRLSRSQRRVRREFRRQMNGYGGQGSQSAQGTGQSSSKIDRTTFGGGSNRIAVHRCAVCGKTELDDPDMEFRFCSKCNGNYEYCRDHLYTHKHVE